MANTRELAQFASFVDFTGSSIGFSTQFNVSGVSTFTNAVIFDNTGYIQVPAGNTAQRDISGIAVTFGQVRYNTQLSQFEGFGAGDAWGSLGGVKDVDGDTFIRAESAAGEDEDVLEFLTGNSTRLVIDSTGRVGIGSTIPTVTLDVVGNGKVSGVLTATTFSGNLATTDLTGSITNAQLAGSIANSKLVNDSVSFGGVSVDLGSSDATPAFDLQHATGYPFTSLTGITTEIVGDTTPQLGGNLDLNSKFITGTGGANITGVVTASSFVTGASGAAIGINTNTISGPAELFIDPAAVGDNTGIVRIKGDLYVDGTTTQINSTSLEIADFVIGIASTATTDLLTDGAGIKIGPDNTFLYEHNSGTNPSLKSSENLNVATGKVYQIAETERLSADTLSVGTGATVHSPASNTLTLGTNSEERFRITSAGSVGIGITDPDRPLHVKQNSAAAAKFGGEAGGDFAIEIGQLSSSSSPGFNATGPTASMLFKIGGTERLRIDSDGILLKSGQAALTSTTLSYPVQVAAASDANAIAIIGRAADDIGELAFYEADKITKLGELQYRQDHLNFRHRVGDIRFCTGGVTEKLRITSDGSVGIGKTDPSGKLEVNGGYVTLRSGASSYPDGISAPIIYGTVGGGSTSFDQTGNLVLQTRSDAGSYNICMVTGDTPTERLRINSAGNIGIGTTNPQYKLHVTGGAIDLNSSSTAFSDGVRVGKNIIGYSGQKLGISNQSNGILLEGTSNSVINLTSSGITFGNSDSSTINFYPDTWTIYNTPTITGTVNFASNVGIGTDNPQRKFVVSNSGAEGLEFFVGDTANGSTINAYNRTTASFTPFSLNAQDYRFSPSGGTEAVRITSAGKVGIGTDNPGTKLDVRGGNWANGDIVVGKLGNAGRIKFRRGADGSDTGSIGFSAADNNSVLSMNVTSGDGTLTFQTNSEERLRITSGGELLVNTTTSRLVEDHVGNGPTPKIQIEATNSDAIMSIISAGTADANRCGTISLGRHRNSTVGDTPTIVQDDDALGAIVFSGGDGTDMRCVGAKIHAEVDGTPGEDDMPGALVFSTTPDGSSNSYQKERLRITSGGSVGIGTDNPGSLVDIASGDLEFSNKSNSSAIQTINFSDGTQGRGKIRYLHDGDNLTFHTFSDERVRITSDGKIGIGTDNPQAKLHVSDGANGLEFNPNSENAVVSYNRVTSTYGPVGFQGSTVALRIGGVGTALKVESNGDLQRPKSLSQEVSTSVSSTSATSCGSFAKATYRSAYVIAQITQGTSYQVGRYLVIHDGTTATTIEESAIATGDMLGTFEGVINSSNVEFRVTMGSASSATVITKIESIVV